MKAFVDGFTSLLAAVATLAVCGLPSWFTYQAILADAAPWWAWISIAALSGVGLLMTVAFLRKAMNGVSPSRERKRR